MQGHFYCSKHQVCCVKYTERLVVWIEPTPNTVECIYGVPFPQFLMLLGVMSIFVLITGNRHGEALFENKDLTTGSALCNSVLERRRWAAGNMTAHHQARAQRGNVTVGKSLYCYLRHRHQWLPKTTLHSYSITGQLPCDGRLIKILGSNGLLNI